MAEFGDVFPRRDLGGDSEVWGRHLEDRIKNLEKAATGVDTSLRNVVTGTNSALANLGQQIPRIEQIQQIQQDTVTHLEAKGRVFAQPTMPLPPDSRALWIDTGDKNTPYRGVEQSVESDFSAGSPFDSGATANWSVVDGSGLDDSPSLVLTEAVGAVWNTTEVWERRNHVSFDLWVMFPSIGSMSFGGAYFKSDTSSDSLGAYLNTLSTGMGGQATLSIFDGSEFSGTSPFDIEAGVWYNLRVRFEESDLIAAVYDGSGNLLAETVSTSDAVPTGYPGVYGYGSLRIDDYEATSARWEEVPDEQAREDAQQALQDAQEAINIAAEAQTTADGKNAIYSGTSEPSGGEYAQGDLFFERDSNGDVVAIKVWNGSSWVEHVLYADRILLPSSIGAISIGDGAVTSPKIQAGAVVSETIAADAIVSDKIAAGAIFGEHIAAGSITANELTVGNFTNLIEDPNLDHPDTAWTLNGGAVVANTSRGRGILINSDGSWTPSYAGSSFTVAPDDRFLFRAHLHNGANSPLRLELLWRDENGADLGVAQDKYRLNDWTDNYEWEIPSPPPGARSARFSFRLEGASTGVARIVSPQILRRATGSLIVNGAITADKLDAEAINGKVITGATIQTASSGGRLVLRSFPDGGGTFGSLQGYDSDGDNRIRLSAGSSTPPFLTFYQDGGRGHAFTLDSYQNGSIRFGDNGSFTDISLGLEDGRIFRTTASSGTEYVTVRDLIQKTNSGPWAMTAGGTNAGDYTHGTAKNVAVTFPSGRFSQPPVVVSSVSEVRVQHAVLNRTRTGCTIRTWNNSGGNGSNNYVYWQAVQMTSQSAGE